MFRCVKATSLLILTVAQVPALEKTLCGDKKGMTPWIYNLTRASYHSSSSPSPFILVIVIAIIIVLIITIIIFLVYFLLVSSLLVSFMPRCRLVALSMCERRMIF